MCGIVLVGGNYLTASNVNMFGQLLYHDTIRGDHSTGVAAGFQPYKDEHFVKIEKAAVPGDVFIESNLWEDVKEHTKHTTSSTGVTSKSSIYPKWMIGHNRYATAGAVNNRNAHPFQHGHITLVHNGSLRQQSLLPEHERFQVDSENVCFAIATIGIEETIKLLNGAYTLVWHDAKEKTVNILRNSERPFHLVENNSSEYYGASEEDMLMWLINRKNKSTVKRHFECEVGVQYIFDVSDGFKFKEERKHELPTFRTSPYVSQRGYYQWTDYDSEYDDYDYGRGYRQQQSTSVRDKDDRAEREAANEAAKKSKTDELNVLLRKHGISSRVGDQIYFEAFDFVSYPTRPEAGQITGYVGSAMDYIEVQGHNCPKERYSEYDMFQGRVVSAYEMNNILNIIVTDVYQRGKAPIMSQLPANRDVPGANVLAKPVETTTVGQMLENLVCAYDPAEMDIPHEDDALEVDLVDVPGAGKILSFPTRQDNVRRTSDNDIYAEDKSKRTSIQDELDESEDDEGDECDISKDGQLFTRKEWERDGALNCCADCGSPIPFHEAHKTVVRNGNSFCETCEKKDSSTANYDDGNPRFWCRHCQENFHTDMESVKDGYCLSCYRKIFLTGKDRLHPTPVIKEESKPIWQNPVLTHRKTLKNRLSVTKVLWEKMNSCGFCGLEVPWDLADKTDFIGQQVICIRCAELLDKDQLPK